MILSETNIFDKGSFSALFKDSDNLKAYKLFIGYNHPQADRYDYTEAEFNTYRSNVFKSEIEAYILLDNNNLNFYVPKYFGVQKISQVLDNNGVDVSSNYLLECCFAMEFIVGKSTKIGSINNSKFKFKYSVDLSELLSKLNAIGIGFVTDCSVIEGASGFKVIDFATVDFSTFEKIE